jgi:putative intracellular protease/amidase
MNILMILSSCAQIPGTERKTGTWFEELAAPYYTLRAVGAQVTLASPEGGAAPIDPASLDDNFQSEATRRFSADTEAQAALANTQALSAIRAEAYDAVFYSGGLGPVFDLSQDPMSTAIVESFHRSGKPVAAVCHGVAALRRAIAPDGQSIVRDRAVTGFSNSEEQAAHGIGVVPFLVEDELKRLGGRYSSGPDWTSHVVVDGGLITGQNPASSEATAQRLLEALR